MPRDRFLWGRASQDGPFPVLFPSPRRRQGAGPAPPHEAAMKRLLALALCAAVGLAAAPAPAAEPAHLDFVRGLRERGYPDLALEYLEKLAANPPASIAATLPLEMARCRLEAAKSITDLAQRQKQYTDARAEF